MSVDAKNCGRFRFWGILGILVEARNTSKVKVVEGLAQSRQKTLINI